MTPTATEGATRGTSDRPRDGVIQVRLRNCYPKLTRLTGWDVAVRYTSRHELLVCMCDEARTSSFHISFPRRPIPGLTEIVEKCLQ